MRLFFHSFFILILGLLFFGYLHEQVHVAIYKSYGIESKVEYLKFFPHIATIGEEPCPVNECNLAHNLNEVVGYHLIVFYVVFGILFISLILLKELDIIFKIGEYQRGVKK